jgi:methyl-accepting chemotaxis protein
MLGVDFGADAKRVLAALNSQVMVLELAPNGTILDSNDVFCAFIGLDLASIKGKRHSVLVDPAVANSPEYKEFLAKIARGECFSQEARRCDKTGREKWLQAHYCPVVGARGALHKVVAIGVDITAAKQHAAENAGKIDAISRVQAMIEFTLDGKVVAANPNFLNLLGYRLEEIQGQHHSMFVDPAYASSPEYQEFWAKLKSGEFIAAEFKRIGKGGREVWIQASYNPIFDLNKQVTKVVKFATDITGRVEAVNQIGAGLSRLAEGDLTQRLATAFIPALEPLRQDFNASIDALEKSMTAIGVSTRAIGSGTGEISAAADDLSQRTEHQASSLEETSASLEQVTTTVKKTAEGAKHARDVVNTAKLDAEKSGEVVREATAAMAAIDKSSKQIGQIIGVIDEIAFQTNLLALNAGVEAARAGDAGRGFAVVASEVRALAQRSAEAAKEIKNLISSSATQVDLGVDLVGQTGKALERIVAQVVEIDNVVSAIAKSAEEQAGALQQVDRAVSQMDQSTQRNAEMAQQTTAAARALAVQTGELEGLTSRFGIIRSGARGERARVRATRVAAE